MEALATMPTSPIFENDNDHADASHITACVSPAEVGGTALPSGLSIAAAAEDVDGCILTGTPDTPTARATYSVKVSTSNGDSLLTLDIVVNPAAPNLAMPQPQTYVTGALVEPLPLAGQRRTALTPTVVPLAWVICRMVWISLALTTGLAA